MLLRERAPAFLAGQRVAWLGIDGASTLHGTLAPETRAPGGD